MRRAPGSAARIIAPVDPAPARWRRVAPALAAGAILTALLACAKGDPPMTSLRGRAPAGAEARDAAVGGSPAARQDAARAAGGPEAATAPAAGAPSAAGTPSAAGAPDDRMVSTRSEQPAAAAGGKGAADDAFAALQAEDPHGGALRFKQFAGHVRVFDMWATWCGPCRMTIPELNKLYDRYRDRGLVVVGISVDDDPSEVVEFQRHVEMRYPSAMFNREIASRLGEPSAIPTTFLVDRNGRLRRTFVGYVNVETLEEEVRRLL